MPIIKTISPARSVASLETPRAVSCLLLCWLCLAMNSVAALPPIITFQPANKTIPVGGTATFVVAAISGSPLSYQWYFQGSRIPGATSSSYTRINAQLTHAGAYYVALTNADGWAISANAILTVTTFTVSNTKDSGDGSLRQAILDANAASGANTITFAIAGTGPHTIAPTSPLPTITGPVVIDGWSQPGYAGTPVIELDGSGAGTDVSGLTLGAGSTGSTIRGLAVNSFSDSGLVILSASNRVAGNFIGTDASGLLKRGNTNDGIVIANAANNTIGGLTTATRNIISGNGLGIRLGGANTSNNVIIGNYVGANSAGAANLGNRLYGVFISRYAGAVTGDPHDNRVGGTSAAEGNLVVNNGAGGGGWDGICVFSSSSIIRNSILGNSIYANGDLGIDLGTNGVTANDSGDGDIGPNNLQNFPVITSAGADGSEVAVAGSINTTANTTLRLEFFTADVAASGNGEGKTYLGYVTVITDGSGNGRFVSAFDRAVTAGQYVTATATVMAASGKFGSTSEFSANVPVTGALIVDTTNDIVDGTTTSVAALLAGKGADGRVSLREALIAANNTPGTETIFLPAGTYTLTRAGTGENLAATGDLDVLESVNLIGAGASSTIVNANGLDRVLEVRNTSTASIYGVTLRGGANVSDGGGLYVNSGATVTIANAILTANSADSGGAIRNLGELALDQVRLMGNAAAVQGGGLYNNGTAVITGSLFDGNTAADHGGAVRNPGTLTVINSTVSGNSANTGNGGGFNTDGVVTLTSVTVTSNTASGTGGGIHRPVGGGGASVNMLNTIVAGNTAPTGPDFYNAVTSLGRNIVGNTSGSSGWVASDKQNVNPLLNALADNGGFTPTHSLQAGSPAINAGSSINAPVIDQRAFLRDAPPDIGAYESNGINPNPDPDVATTKSGPVSVFATTNFSYTIAVTNLSPSTASNIVVSDRLPAGIKVVSASGGGTVVGGDLGQVVFDQASSSVSVNIASGVLTWMHVTTNTANRLMLVGVSFGSGAATINSTVTTLTYGGVNLTKVVASTNNLVGSELWQLVDPPSGTNTVALTFDGAPTTVVGGAATFSGVDPATPLSAVSSAVGKAQGGTKITSFTLSSTPNEIVFDNLTISKNRNPIADADQTELWNIGGAQIGAASIKPGTNLATLSWTAPQTVDWIDLAASVKAASFVGVVTWKVSSLAYGATTNFTVTVTAPLDGNLSNSVSSTAGTLDANPANNDGSATNAQVITSVIPIADVVTTQTGPTSVNPLTNYTYTVTVSNLGPSTASHVVVSDTLAPMLTFVSASGGGTYLAGAVTWPALASLGPGASADFTVTVRAPISGSLTNTASSTATTADPNLGNNDGSAPAAQVVTVVSPLQIANTSFGASVQTLNWSHTVAPGSSRILIVGVSIDNPTTTVTAANFNNFLPLTFIGQANGTQSRVAMYYLLNPPVGTYSVSVTLAGTVGVVGGAVSLNGVNQANPIASFVGNTGTGTNASVTVASALGGVVIDTVAPKSPRRATFPDPAQTLEWNLSGANFSGAGSSSYGAASVTPSWTLDSSVAWAMGAVALRPAAILADLTLSATGPASVPATSNLTYTIAVTNLGSSTASNVVVSDVLPAGATFVGATGGGTNDAGVVTWPTLRTLASGARTNFTVTVTVPSFGTLTNIIYGTAFTADPDPSNNNGTGDDNQVVTAITPLADVATSVTGPASVLATSDFSYTVTLTNVGPSPASEVVVSDALPAGTTFVSASDGGAHHAGVVAWTLASLDSGSVTNFSVTVTAPAGGTLTNSARSTATSSDLNAANNDGSAPSAQVITTVAPQADVATTVTGPASVVAISDFSYILTVTNAGPSPASEVVVSNTLPFGTTFVSASAGGSHNAGVVNWSIPSLATGAATNFTVAVTAPADGMLINIAACTSATPDLVPDNNDGSAADAQVHTTVTPLADIATTVIGPAIAITNAPFSYTVTVANLGPSVATGVAVNDALPVGATFVSASDGGTHNAGRVTWSLASLESAAGTSFTVTILAPAIGSLTNTVSGSALAGDPDASNNDGTAVAARVVTGVYPLLLLTGQQLPEDGFQVEFHTHPDTIVSIGASTNLLNWGTLITTNSGDGHVIFIDQDVASYPQRFYRSRQGP